MWVAAILFSLVSCKHGMRAIDTRPEALHSTITGDVRGSDNTRRTVEAVNIDNGARQRATTSPTGGFSFRLEPGKYRIVLTVHDGETIVRQPDVIDVNESGIAGHADFVVAPPRVARPRSFAPRGPDGLGSAIG